MNAKLTTSRDRLRDAIERRDARQVGRIVELLRFGCGKNYEQCHAIAHDLTGISLADWDELLYEADQVDLESG